MLKSMRCLIALASLPLLSCAAQQATSKPASTPAIARMWHGRTTDAKAAEYYEYLNSQGIDKIRQIPGNMGVDVFTRSHDGETEFTVISYWPSLDAIRAYAGPDIEKTHNLPRDAEFLIEMEPTVKHFVIRRSER
jgi:heme-degrading monooxygenase HmoA